MDVSAGRTGWFATPAAPMSVKRHVPCGSGREWWRTLDATSMRAAKIVGVSKDFELLARCERDVRTALADHCHRRTFAALLPRHHPSARQQGDGAFRRSQNCWPCRSLRSPSSAMAATMSRCSSGVAQHRHGQCQSGGAAGRGFRDGQQSRRRLRQRDRAVHPWRRSLRTDRLRRDTEIAHE